MAAVAALLLGLACGAQALEDPYPKAGAAYLVERDGKRLWGGGIDRRLAPASLAKMMTALLAIEDGSLDRLVTVGAGAARETGTKLGLREGERLRARDLLTASILRSANDACMALAEDGGPRASFVERMNRRAAELGMKDTRFIDPCGHDRRGQFATASDLARLAGAVARRDEYLAISKLERAVVATEGGSRTFSFDNTNALIGRYEGAIGLKTGTTPEAGTCLAALAERGGSRVLLILLNAKDRWWGAAAILDRAFAQPRP
ncbi:MAG: D-alanyl-D-alanine carboxypeptidase [Elusimicrobia bacterium]|nr:D-alanyl-D-alanine carboxypeptidase [Elusimicrobiota bacterium]